MALELLLHEIPAIVNINSSKKFEAKYNKNSSEIQHGTALDGLHVVIRHGFQRFAARSVFISEIRGD